MRAVLVANRSTETNVDDEASLIARIIENPHDDALRMVLADLFERGDPRGEHAPKRATT